MNGWVQIAGAALVHFVWQGSAIALATAVAWALCRSRSPQFRYAVGCLALGAMLSAPVATAYRLSETRESLRLTSAPTLGNRGAASRGDHSGAGAGPPLPAPIAIGVPNEILPVLVTVWFAGVTLLLLRVGLGWRQVRRLRRVARASSPSNWSDAANRLAKRLGIRSSVRIAELSSISVPAVIAWYRPIIVLPIAAVAQLPAEQVEAILAHELVHIRRYDFVLNLLQAVVEAVLFYHPAVWWVSGRVREEREHCCDDVVVAMLGQPEGYVSALAHLERFRTTTESAVALAATGGPLLRRARRILQVPGGDDGALPNWLFTLALVATFVVALGGPQRTPALLAHGTDSVARALATSFEAGWTTLGGSGHIDSAGAVVFTVELDDVQSVPDGGYLTVQVDGPWSSRRAEFTAVGASIHRRYFVDGREQPWNDDAAGWLATELPFLVRRSGISADGRIHQLVQKGGVDAALDEVGRLATDAVRGAYARALLRTVGNDPTASSVVLASVGELIGSSLELARVLDAAIVAGTPAGDTFYEALDRVTSSMEQRRVLLRLLDERSLGDDAELKFLDATGRIDSSMERAVVLDAFLDRHDALGAPVRQRFRQVASAIGSTAERTRLLARVADVTE